MKIKNILLGFVFGVAFAYINLNGIINKQKRLIERLNLKLVKEKHKKNFYYNALKKEFKYQIKKL